jgi:hypothetical protein
VRTLTDFEFPDYSEAAAPTGPAPPCLLTSSCREQILQIDGYPVKLDFASPGVRVTILPGS